METNIDVVYSGNKNLIKGFSCLRMKAFIIFVPYSTPLTWLALCLILLVVLLLLILGRRLYPAQQFL